MRRSLTVLGLILFSVCAYAAAGDPVVSTVVNAGGCLKTWTFKSKGAVWTGRWDQKDSKIIDADMKLINSDLADLKTSYTCVHDASVKVANSDVNQNKAIISDAVEINKYAAAFKAHLSDLTDNINNASTTETTSTFRSLFSTKPVGETSNMLSKTVKALALVITNVDFIVTNSATLASGNFAKYETARNSVSMGGPQTDEIKVEDVITPIINKTKDDASLKEKESLLSKLDGVEQDKIKETFVGDYATPDKLTEFTTNLKNKKYALSNVDPSNNRVITNNNANNNTNNGATNDNNANSNTNSNANSASADSKSVEQTVKDALDKKTIENMQKDLDAIKLKESIPPASTTANTTAGGGASGNISAQAPQPYDPAREAERKKWLERAKQMDNESMKRAMAQAMKGGKGVSQSKFVKERGSAFSLRDLFGKSDETTTTPTDKKDKDLAFMDKDFLGASGTGTDKYKKYYGTGVGPNDISSKNLNRSNFDSMYEQARIKALTEDATEQLAGRYVDPFLLIHSIIYDYYIRGLLVDTSEVVDPVSLKSSPRI